MSIFKKIIQSLVKIYCKMVTIFSMTSHGFLQESLCFCLGAVIPIHLNESESNNNKELQIQKSGPSPTPVSSLSSRVHSPNVAKWNPDIRVLQSSQKWLSVSIINDYIIFLHNIFQNHVIISYYY